MLAYPLRSLALFSTLIASFGCGGEREPQRAPNAGAGSGNGGSDGQIASAGAATGVNVAGTAGADVNECTRFKLETKPTCDGCPSAPLSCACLSELAPLDSFQRCTDGRCLLALDCAGACADSDLSALISAANGLVRCLSTPFCSSDGECGKGKCVSDAPHHARCQSGLEGAPCVADDDCTEGRPCVVGPNGFASCESGQSTCNDDTDCSSKKCAVSGMTIATSNQPPVAIGTCTSGEPGQNCSSDAQCLDQGHCSMLSGAQFPGVCGRGRIGDACDGDAVCQSQICVAVDPNALGICTSGADGDRCAADGDCTSQRCLRLAISMQGSCTSGSVGSPCFEDADCLSNSCPGKGDFAAGICQ